MKAGLVREWRIVERDRRLRLDAEPGAGRAVVVAGADGDRERLARLHRPVGSRQFDLQLRRHEILDAELDAADRRRFRVEFQFGMPGADPRVARQGIGDVVRAERVARQLPLLDLDPVRPHQSERHRQPGRGVGLIVAHQPDEMHAFTRAVDAAIGVEKRVNRPRWRAAADAAVRQVERGASDFEEIEIAIAAVGHDRVGLVAAAPAQHRRRDARQPIGIGRRRRELAIVVRIEL